jgi:glycosyltransferase involved in cell wall biosynthesis
MRIITIVAPNIKTGGGKELLEYLLEYIYESYPDVLVNVYIDKSLNIADTHTRKVFITSSVISKTVLFFKSFKNVIYFGNLPPMIKAENSLVYFHNLYLLMSLRKLFSNKNSKLINLVKEMIKQFYIKKFVKNVDYVVCQTDAVGQEFKIKYAYENIKILPFFRTCKDTNTVKKFDYCYVSLAHPHKNHKNFFLALKLLEEKNLDLSIAVTVETKKKELIQMIEEINKRGVIKVVNFGLISKKKVCALYSESRCLVFPSIEESFGLPLLEAVDLGLDVIASDLGYVYQVIEPSCTFNPNDIRSIAETIQKHSEGIYSKSQPKIKNSIFEFIELVLKEVE